MTPAPRGQPRKALPRAARVVVARRSEEIAGALEQIEALRLQGCHLAGYFAYEAGLALEPRLAPLAARRNGAAGPLLWFGAFDGYEVIAADDVPAWLAGQAGEGAARIGPLDPQLSPGGYAAAFAELQEAIAAGDIYQANLTFPSPDPIAAIRWRFMPRCARRRARAMAGSSAMGRTGCCHARPNCSSRSKTGRLRSSR